MPLQRLIRYIRRHVASIDFGWTLSAQNQTTLYGHCVFEIDSRIGAHGHGCSLRLLRRNYARFDARQLPLPPFRKRHGDPTFLSVSQ